MNKRKFLALAVATAIAGTTMLWVTSAYEVTYHPEANVSYTLNWNENFTGGLITITDWNETYTIMDRNLWATKSGSTCSSSDLWACWYYFQWWNNYWFPTAWSVATSKTQVDASEYWPWHYYSSSTFITKNPWDSSNNNNLRWWEDGTNEAMQWPCPEWYHVPSSGEWLGLSTMLWYNGSEDGEGSIQAINRLINELYIPFAGYRYYSSAGALNRGAIAYYWSSTAYSAGGEFILSFYSSGLYPQNGNYRSNGYSVRCFKNSPYSTSDLSSEQQPIVAEILLSVRKWTLTIWTTTWNLNLWEVNVSNNAQELSWSFGENSFWVEDMKWVETWYYTTISVTDLTWTVASHVISANNVYLKTAWNEPSYISWAIVSDSKVVFSNDIKLWHNNWAEPVTYFNRQNTPSNLAWRVWKWWDNLQIKVNIPAHTPFDTYRWIITYTLYDNDL